MNGFDEYLQHWCHIVANFQKKDLDFVEVVAGTEGSGKSTFALYKMMQYLRFAHENDIKLNDFQMQLYENKEWKALMFNYVFLSAREFLEAIYEEPWRYKRAVILIDEAGRDMFSREAMGKINKLLTKFFITSRFLNNLYFLCVPKPKYLDIYLREERSYLISWILLRVHYDKQEHAMHDSRTLLSIPRVAFQYLIEKYGWRKLMIKILRLEIEDIEQVINRWRSSLPIVGIYPIPPNLHYRLHPDPLESTRIWQEYLRVKTNEGFYDFLLEVKEKLLKREF